MSTAMSYSARSVTGCWTCRVRKKKCDERRPACFRCHSLQLECDGYGPRPDWMDNSTLQKAQALRLKEQVRQTHSRRQKQCSPLTGQSQSGRNYNQDSPSKYSASSSVEEISISGSGFNADGVGDFGFQCQDSRMIDFDHDIWNISFQNDICAMGSLPGQRSRVDSSSTPEWSLLGYSPETDTSPIQVAENSSNLLLYPGATNRCRESEDDLLMHYLDKVFPIQYPFYNIPSPQPRGWLFSVIRQTKSTYYATLALVERHILSKLEPGLGLQPRNSYHDLALQEVERSLAVFHTWSEMEQLTHSTQELSCILQLFFSEVVSGDTRSWRSYLAKAATFIPPLVKAVVEPVVSSRTTTYSSAQQPGQEAVNFGHEMTPKVLLSTFIAYDVLGCASTRSKPSLKIDHRLVLDTMGIDLQSLFGYANWVLILILEIVLLDNWKKEAERNGRLSMVELVKRGTAIEERLQQKVRDLENTHSQDANPFGSSGNLFSPSIATETEVTKIFAFSALTYLHVVVSGAYVELPEITESVLKTIFAFERLSDLKLLRHLAWPFCVCGCLALKAQQSFFKDLISRARSAGYNLGSCLQAFKIIEECWEFRNVQSSSCNWALIIDRQENDVILI